MQRILAICLAWALSACGGGGSGPGGSGGEGSGDGGGGETSAADHAAQAAALGAAAARLSDIDPTVTLPVSGSATYAGHLGATAAPEGAPPLFVTGALTLDVRFGAGTVSGTFAGVSSADGTVSGSGAFTDGRFGPAGIDAGVAGTLVVGGEAHSVAGSFRGAFLGPGAEGLAGAVEAGLARGGVPSGRLDGEVWAER